MKWAIRIDERDNVAMATEPILKGEAFTWGTEAITAVTDISLAHKVAIEDIAPGADIYKYGVSIGVASEMIPVGAQVHVHNVISHTLCK